MEILQQHHLLAFGRLPFLHGLRQPYLRATFTAYGSPVNLNQESMYSFRIRFRSVFNDGPSYKPACTFLWQFLHNGICFRFSKAIWLAKPLYRNPCLRTCLIWCISQGPSSSHIAQGNPREDRETRFAYRSKRLSTFLPRSHLRSANFHSVLYGNRTGFSLCLTFIERVFPCFLNIFEHDVRWRCAKVIAQEICSK